MSLWQIHRIWPNFLSVKPTHLFPVRKYAILAKRIYSFDKMSICKTPQFPHMAIYFTTKKSMAKSIIREKEREFLKHMAWERNTNSGLCSNEAFSSYFNSFNLLHSINGITPSVVGWIYLLLPIILRRNINEIMEKQEINVRFGNRMRELRARYDVSQEQLALRSELNRTYIGDIERGEKTPSLITLSKIANGLGITLKEMFDYWI